MTDPATKREWLASLRQQPQAVAYGLTVTPLWLLIAVLCVAWLATGCTTGYPRDQVRQLSNEHGSGSGVVIRPGLILTARHVARAKGLKLTSSGRVGTEAILSEEEPVDLGLLRFPLNESSCPCVKLADSEAKVDEPVYLIGFPMGITEVVTLGNSQGVMEVNVKDDFGTDNKLGRRLVMTVGAQPGNSGGGVFVYRHGEYQLVGILTEMLNRPGGVITFAIPLNEIKDFLAGRA